MNLRYHTVTHPTRLRPPNFGGVVALLATLWAITPPAHATTKGFNQIITPDVQPEGVLSLSVQGQNPQIGDGSELQEEYGITNKFEVAVFEGFSPNEQVLNTEFSLIAKGPYLLSTGFANWTTRGGHPQPFLEGGYYQGKSKFVLGALRTGSRTEGLYGYGYQLTPRIQLQADYQTSLRNFKTAGFTYNITPDLSFNPSLYFSNDHPHHVYGYGVLTWNLKVR